MLFLSYKKHISQSFRERELLGLTMESANIRSRKTMNHMLHSLSSATHLQARADRSPKNTIHVPTGSPSPFPIHPTAYGGPPPYAPLRPPAPYPFVLNGTMIPQAAVAPMPTTNNAAAYTTITTVAAHPPPIADPHPQNPTRERWANPLMPASSTVKMLRSTLPRETKITNDAKELIQGSIGEFLSVISGEANDRCVLEQRKIVNADDIKWALTRVGFFDYMKVVNNFVSHTEFERSNKRRRLAITGPINNPHVGPGTVGGGLFTPQIQAPKPQYEDETTMSLFEFGMSLGVDLSSVIEQNPDLFGPTTVPSEVPSCGSSTSAAAGGMGGAAPAGGNDEIGNGYAPGYPYFTSLLCGYHDELLGSYNPYDAYFN